MEDKRLKALVRGLAALSAAAGLLVFALPALANAPDPNTTTVDQVVVNSDGSRIVTVEGTWTWASDSNCANDRNGIGYQIDWFDNQTNAIGQAGHLDGILYVGTANDNIVHSDQPLGGSMAFGKAMWDGVPSSYLPSQSGATSSTPTTPSKSDASNWVSDCTKVNSQGVPAGTWGPITHTYVPSFTGPITLCPIFYDPHGHGSPNFGGKRVGDITAGKNAFSGGYNNDNSYETNGDTPNGTQCPKVSIPTITTSASSAAAGSPIHDTATVTGSGGAQATISWNVYDAKNDPTCKKPLNSSPITKSINGDGTFDSPDFSPSGSGSYQWVASYSSSTISGISTACNDPNEVSTVGEASPSIVTAVSPASAVVGDVIKDTATLSGGSSPTGTITWKLYSDSGCTNLVDTISVPVDHGNGAYTADPGFTTSDPGVYFWVAKYSGDANNNPASTSCGDPSEETTVNSPGIQVEKLASAPCADLASSVTQPPGITPCNGTWSSYTHDIITVSVPNSGSYSIPIDYQIRVTNTGSTPLTLKLDDPLCDPSTVTGPTAVKGTLTGADGTTLSANGAAVYTCTHTLTQDDPNTSISGEPFTNTAMVTGKPPSGPSVHGTGIVTVDRQPLPPPQRRRFCRSIKTHKKVLWPKGTPKPQACRKPPPPPHPRRPKHPHGFTG